MISHQRRARCKEVGIKDLMCRYIIGYDIILTYMKKQRNRYIRKFYFWYLACFKLNKRNIKEILLNGIKSLLVVKLLIFSLFYTPGSGSTDPNECGSDHFRIQIPGLKLQYANWLYFLFWLTDFQIFKSYLWRNSKMNSHCPINSFLVHIKGVLRIFIRYFQE